MFPFIFLLSTQVFLIHLFNDNQINIFKYSGLKNTKIIRILSYVSFLLGVLIITLFYNFSSNLKNIYLEFKNKYTDNNSYLAVITKNGLWIKDLIDNEVKIINASKIDENFLIDVFISEFDSDFNLKRSIISNKVDIKNNQWVIFEPKILENNSSQSLDKISLNSNFNYQRIQNLYSNLSSFSLLELIKLKENYKKLNYSTTEVDIQLQKLISFPIYLTLMSVLSALIMFNTKKFKSSTLKITFGLFLSVLIYYINNFLYVLGNTEKISFLMSIWIPLVILMSVNIGMSVKINEK
jgi:lipopolysaccharide export system permease protein